MMEGVAIHGERCGSRGGVPLRRNPFLDGRLPGGSIPLKFSASRFLGGVNFDWKGDTFAMCYMRRRGATTKRTFLPPCASTPSHSSLGRGAIPIAGLWLDSWVLPPVGRPWGRFPQVGSLGRVQPEVPRVREDRRLGFYQEGGSNDHLRELTSEKRRARQINQTFRESPGKALGWVGGGGWNGPGRKPPHPMRRIPSPFPSTPRPQRRL